MDAKHTCVLQHPDTRALSSKVCGCGRGTEYICRHEHCPMPCCLPAPQAHRLPRYTRLPNDKTLQ